MAHHMEMEVTVLLPAGKIPVGATVSKKTGTKPYKLLDRLRVFSPNADERQEIKAQPGTVFLVCDGDANAIPTDTVLKWTTTAESLCHHLKYTLDPYRDSGK